LTKGFAFVGLLLFATTLCGDVLTMNNGDRITGTLDSVSGGRLIFSTEYANNIVIDLASVANLATDESYRLRLENGENFSGKLSVNAVGEQQVLAADGSRQGLNLVDVRRLGQDNLKMPDLEDGWENRLDLSAVISKGNSDTQSFNLLGESKLKKGKVEQVMSLSISQEEADETKTRDQIDLDYGYKRFLNEKWYAAGNGEYFQDRIKDIDQRITLGAGLGHQFWDNSFGALSAEFGASAVFENLDGDSGTNPALRWALNYNRFLLDKKAEFFHKHSLLVILDSDSGEVIQSSTGFRFALSDKVDTSVRVDTTTDTEPPVGSHRSDITYNLGVGIKF